MNNTQTKSTAMQTAARKRKLNTDEGNGNDKENLRPLFDLNYFFSKQQQDKNLPKE